MKLFRVDNKYSSYGLNSYLVIAKTEQEAIEMAGTKLKEYALDTNFTINELAYRQVGIPINNIFEHMDHDSYLSHFTAKCLSEDITHKQTIRI
ncbi:hypothetical protein WGM54_14835 [Paenibacillus polymyxa]|uniref:hypothetical protein n=1 Tax=Paenibacillus polymyxa TaxID=1406 RepID=UPI00307D89CE